MGWLPCFLSGAGAEGQAGRVNSTPIPCPRFPLWHVCVQFPTADTAREKQGEHSLQPPGAPLWTISWVMPSNTQAASDTKISLLSHCLTYNQMCLLWKVSVKAKLLNLCILSDRRWLQVTKSRAGKVLLSAEVKVA